MTTSKNILGKLGDEGLKGMWTAKAGDSTLMTMPKAALVRAIVMNHWIHHRGQLSVYLRLLDVPVPLIYGPSADENVRRTHVSPSPIIITSITRSRDHRMSDVVVRSHVILDRRADADQVAVAVGIVDAPDAGPEFAGPHPRQRIRRLLS